MGSVRVHVCALCDEDQVGRRAGDVCEVFACGGRVVATRRPQRFLDHDPFRGDATEGDEYTSPTVPPPPGHPVARAWVEALGPDDRRELATLCERPEVSAPLRRLLAKAPAMAEALDALAAQLKRG